MARNRSGSRLSFRRASSSSVPKVDAYETPDEKARFQLYTKADPSKAIVEAQPADVATAESTMGMSLRQLEHRDPDGNVIADPDRSNPTRPRLERPLDTIRSFEAAIDGSYSRRQSTRPETSSTMHPQSRRSSYFNGYAQRKPQVDGGAYYGGRSMGDSRPGSYYDNGNAAATSYYGQGGRRFGPRNNSDPALYGSNHNSHSNSHGHHQSHDTVGTTSNGSHFTDPWGNSTDPSSENSSIDRAPAVMKPDPDPYAFNGYGHNPQLRSPIMEEHDQHYDTSDCVPAAIPYASKPAYAANSAPPPVPAHDIPQPPPKDNMNQSRFGFAREGNFQTRRIDDDMPPPPPPESEKRKSWLKKRFSRA